MTSASVPAAYSDSVAALRSAWKEIIRLADKRGDVILAGAMAIAGLVEALVETSNGFPPATLLATVPLAWRRRWPMAVMAVVFLGAAFSREAPYVEITAAAIAAYSVGAHERRRLLGVAELVVVGGIVLFEFGGALPQIPDPAGPFLILLPLWLVGNGIRQGRLRADAMAERAKRLEQAQRLTAKAAQAEEQARLARELHDVVAHSVSVMVVQAGAARQVVEQTPDRALEALRAVEDTGRQAMKELRQILGVLGDAEADFGPQPSLSQLDLLVHAVRDAGLSVELEIRGAARPLPPSLELTAFRIVQEALTNALKHSGMAATRVAIDYRTQELKIEVLTDGTVPSKPTSTTGRGLAGMRERIALLGGRLEAGPGVERGYVVRAWLPLDAMNL